MAGWKADPFLLMGFTNDDLIAMFTNMLEVELHQRRQKLAKLTAKHAEADRVLREKERERIAAPSELMPKDFRQIRRLRRI